MTFGERVNHMRVVLGLTVAALALKANVRIAKLSAIEAGTAEATTRERIGLARELRVSVAYLESGEGEVGLKSRPAFVALVQLLEQLSPPKQDELLVMFAQAIRHGLKENHPGK